MQCKARLDKILQYFNWKDTQEVVLSLEGFAYDSFQRGLGLPNSLVLVGATQSEVLRIDGLTVQGLKPSLCEVLI